MTSSAAGNGIVLNTGTGNFINNAGAAALTANGGGRWLIYSVSPALDTFGGLNSANLALWGKTYATYAPASVVETGNRYLFSLTPTLTVNEIVGISNQIHKIPEDVIAVNTPTTGEGGSSSALPVCN